MVWFSIIIIILIFFFNFALNGALAVSACRLFKELERNS